MKKRYAMLLLQNQHDTLEAATALCPGEFSKATFVHMNWTTDPIVVAEMQRLREKHDPQEFLPTETDYLWELWGDIKSYGILQAEEKLKAMRLFADVRGFIKKGEGNQTNIQIINPPVMQVPMFQSDGQWEAMMQEQQKTLTITGHGLAEDDSDKPTK